MMVMMLEMEMDNVDENVLLALVWFSGLVDCSLCKKFLANNADANVLRTFSWFVNLYLCNCICVIVFVHLMLMQIFCGHSLWYVNCLKRSFSRPYISWEFF